ncbi:MAG: DUF5683 domain-containing protein [Phaeodactylibacter sp.]|uniref:DUF5683 domain-containing protein n=1 Tax=Phaeodactylibacter sp. TaxID=1940289 RepID=UPI0032EBFEA5
MKSISYTIALALTLWASAAVGQAPPPAESPADTAVLSAAEAATDSLQKPKRQNWLTRDYPSPRKAAILALAIPGGGQIYNKRWWKLPLVYGAVVGMGLTIDYNQSNYRRLRDALELKRDTMEHEFSGTSIDNERALRSLRDEFDKNTQMAYVGMFLVYTLQALEAFVDAHLKSFDIDDDIGMEIKPTLDFHGLSTPTIGLGVTIPLNRKPPTLPVAR